MLLVACSSSATVWAQDPAADASIVAVGPHLTVDRAKREVALTATVCLRLGILEYLVCREHSYEHESVFTTAALPSHLHAALLLIAREPCAYADEHTWAERALRQPSAWLDITVEVPGEGGNRRVPLDHLVDNREREDRRLSGRWIFTGSFFVPHEGRELYAADHHGGVIGLTPKGASVVQHGSRLGIPYHGEHLGVACRTDAIPAVGTTVRLIFSVPSDTDAVGDATP